MVLLIHNFFWGVSIDSVAGYVIGGCDGEMGCFGTENLENSRKFKIIQWNREKFKEI